MSALSSTQSQPPIRLLLAIGSLGGGGSERQMIGLLKQLDRSRFRPMLYLLHDGGALRHEVPPDVPVHIFASHHQTPRVNWPGRIHRQQVADLRQLITSWQVDCVYDRNFQTTLVTGPAACGCRRISTVVSDPDTDLRRQETRFVSWKRRLLRRAYRGADRVVAVSSGVRQALIDDYQVSPGKVVKIYESLDLERIDLMRDAEPAIAMSGARLHIVGAGRLLEAKGWLDLLEAARILVHQRRQPTLQFHILGEGPLREELERRIAKSGLEDHFKLEGFQSNPYSIFQRASVICHPSYYEGLPNVILEAMACETPVVATDCRWGPREILEDGRWGELSPVADPAALADCLERCISAGDQFLVRTAAAREHVESTFGTTQSVRHLERLIENVCRQDS